MSVRFVIVGTAFLAFVVGGLEAQGADRPASSGNWPAWRRDGSGVSDQRHLPVVWSESENLLWRTELPGEGNSSPVVWGNRVFLTAASDKGAKRLVLCLNADTGKILWRAQFLPDAPSTFYEKTGFAAPTPATDGQRVYATFDTPGMVALDMRGKTIWKHSFGAIRSPYNMGSSPVFYKDTVLQCCDHNGEAFLAALDCQTGDVRWRTARKSSTFGHYGTPLVIQVDGRFQVVVNGEPVIAYDPDTGKELWSCRGMKECVGPSPAFGHGLLYASSGRTGPVMAIDPRGRGDVTETHVRLHLTSGGPYVPTPLVYPLLLVPGDNGRMLFYNAAGALVLEGRVRDHFTSSPVGADGKIYWCSERGKTYVIDAASLAGGRPQFRLLSVNQLRGPFLATPAIAGARLFLRSSEALYCVAETGKARLAHSPRILSGTFAELKSRYEKHQAVWTNEPEAQIRLETLEAIARLDDPAVVPFLAQTVQKEPHWDICEEAVKCLGRKGPAAVDPLLGLVKDSRPFVRTVAISDLGRLRVAKALPQLLAAAHDRQPLVRCASLVASSQIAEAEANAVGQVIAALIAVLVDRNEESVVKQSALDGLAILAPKARAQREEILRTLAGVQGCGNPRLAKKAEEIRNGAYQGDPAAVEKE